MDINNFGPFNADTWGSVSDWLITGFTLGSIIFLWRTLTSQKKVQQLQQSLSKIDTLRYLKEIKPDFLCETRNGSIDGDFSSLYIYLVPIKNKAQFLKYAFVEHNGTLIDQTNFNGVIPNNSYQINEQINLHIKWKQATSDGILIAKLVLNYTDDIETQYSIVFELNLDVMQPKKTGPDIFSYPELYHSIDE